MRVLGVDPGAVSGAFALLSPDAPPVVGDIPVVNRQVDAAQWSRIIGALAPDIAVVELTHSMPQQGVSSTFRFAFGCGLIRGALAGAGVPIFDAAPTKWKKHFGLNSEAERSRALAIQRFPRLEGLSRKKDHNRAEALLLALWRLETDVV